MATHLFDLPRAEFDPMASNQLVEKSARKLPLFQLDVAMPLVWFSRSDAIAQQLRVKTRCQNFPLILRLSHQVDIVAEQIAEECICRQAWLAHHDCQRCVILIFSHSWLPTSRTSPFLSDVLRRHRPSWSCRARSPRWWQRDRKT